jgi:hypothetical protein
MLVFLVASTTLPSAAVEPDPWTRVPAAPAGGYQSDGFADKLAAARDALVRDIDRQTKINDALAAKVKELDPMEAASRQQQYMMDHPEEAMKLMQRNQQLGQTFSNAEAASNDERKSLMADLDEIDARCKAALEKALAPVNAKYADLDKRAQKDIVRTEGGDFYAPWAVKELNVLRSEENAAYESFSKTWWGSSGAYQEWLSRYREHLAKRVPQREEAELVGAGFMAQIIGTPEASFKPTSNLSAVKEYIDEVDHVFARRRSEPLAPAEDLASGGTGKR